MQQKLPDWVSKVMENLKESKLQPIFSHEVIVSSMVKMVQTKGGTEKEAQVLLIFVDMTNFQPVGKYVVSVSTAQGLVDALKTHLDNLQKQLKSKEVPKETVTPTVSKELSYIG